jgi:hypothetical protein
MEWILLVTGTSIALRGVPHFVLCHHRHSTEGKGQAMKNRVIIASIALVLGAVLIRFSPFTLSTTEELFHVGIFSATRENIDSLVLPTAIGWAALFCGMFMLASEVIQFVCQSRRS